MKAETVGKRIYRLRQARGLSQRDLSEPGVSYAYISRIEAEARTPSVKALRKIAGKLGVTVEYLETGKDETLADDLIAEISRRVGSPVRIVAYGGMGAHVRYERDDVLRSHRAGNLTEALLAAVAQERERDRIREEIERLANRERELAGGGERA